MKRRIVSLLLGLSLAAGGLAAPATARAGGCADLAGAIFYHSEQGNHAYQTVLLKLMYENGCF